MTANQPTTAGASVSREARLAELMEQLAHKLQQGQPLALDSLEAAWPDLADDVRAMLPMLEVMVELSGADALSILGSARVGENGHPPHRRLGDFRIVREIGRGGMGIVYEAEQLSLGRRVALKVLPFAGMLDERARTRFKNEARAAATLEHPHIVPVFGSGEERGVYYYVMQLIRGRTLAEVIAGLRQQSAASARNNCESQLGTGGNGGNGVDHQNPPPCSLLPPVQTFDRNGACPVPAAETPWPGGSAETARHDSKHFRRVAEIGIQVAEALEYAHQHGVIHRDIKPSNLLLDANGKVWVTDFGLAAVDSSPTLTLTGDLLGTLRYMSPEQATAQRELVDQRTDVYSLGATLYELLTLEPAFGQAARTALLQAVLERDPVAPRRLNDGVPLGLEVIVLKAMSKEPAGRYLTAAAMADDLRRFVEAKPIAARRRGRVRRGWKWTRRHSSAVVGSMLVAATLLFAGSVAMVLGSRFPTGESGTKAPGASAAIIPAEDRTGQSGPIPVPPGLIAWWSGDGHADDLTGAHHGSLAGGATYAPGLVGQAFSFDGINDYVRVPHDSALNPAAGFTIEGWIRPSRAAQGFRCIVSKWNMATRDSSYSFQCRPDMRLLINLSQLEHADLGSISGRASVLPETWVHVAATYDTDAVRIYFDGVLDAIRTVDRGRTVRASVTDLLVGASTAIGKQSVSNHFAGLIDELSLYNRALSAAEIHAIYEAGGAGKRKPNTFINRKPANTTASPAELPVTSIDHGLDNPLAPIPTPPGLIAWWSGDGHANDFAGTHHGTLEAGASYAPGLVGQAFSLDGVDDYIRVPHDPAFNLAAGFTIEGWIRSEATAGPRVIVSKMWDSTTSKGGYILKDHNDNSSLRLQVMHAPRYELADIAGITPIRLGAWIHVGATFDTEVATIYIDGVQDAVTSTPLLPIGNSANDLLIGGVFISERARENFCGLIDELSLYNRALSAEEILAIVQAGSSGKRKPRSL